MHVGQGGKLEDLAFGRAGQPRQRRRQREHDQLVAIDLIAQRNGARLVLADRLQDLAKGRMHDPVDQKDAAEGDRQHEIVQRHVRAQRNQSEQITARHRLDAVLAAGEGHLKGKEIDHLREGQRHHGEIDPLPPDRQRADDQPQQSGGHGAGKDRQFRRQSPDFRGMGGNIACPAEIGRVPEGQKSAETEKQVERIGEKRKTHDLHGKDGIDPVGQQQRQPQQDQKDHLVQPRHADAFAQGAGLDRVFGDRHQPALPKRPSGRNSSTIAMMTKMTTADPSG